MAIPADEIFDGTGAGPEQAEAWSFEAVTGQGAGILVRWTVFGASRRAWYWALLADADGRVVVVRDEEVAPPRGRTLAVRTDGLWADGTCEIPHEHWSLGLEAFAVALDDAADGWAGERGERVPFGFELDWERTSDSIDVAGGYAQSGRLGGEVVVGRTVHRVDGGGLRCHRYVAAAPSAGAELRLGGSRLPDVRPVAEPETGPDGLPRPDLGGTGPFRVTARAAIVAGGGRRALAAGFGATDDGEAPGWLEVVV